jgi:hypothetical protein
VARTRVLVLLLLLVTTACGTRVREVTPSPSATPSTPAPSASASPSASPSSSASPSPAGSAGPTAGGSPSASPGSSASPAGPATGALRLVGWWQVTQPAGAGHLGLGDDLVVVHPCGRTLGSWAASPSGLFLALPRGGDSSCYAKPPRPDVRWLEQGRSFALSGQELVLRGYDGQVVGRATREKAPSGQQERQVTDTLRERLAAPAPLPDGPDPATATSIVRRWEPRGTDAGNGNGYVAFARSGVWSGSDGCNSAGGAYALGADGELLTASYPTTAVGCDSTPAPAWVARARSAGLRGEALELYDGDGALLGRLYPA